MAVVTPLNNFLGPEGDTVTVDEQLLNTQYSTFQHGRGGPMHGEFLRHSLLFLQAHRRLRHTSLPLECHRKTPTRKHSCSNAQHSTTVGLTAAKAAALRVNLNVQGCVIIATPMHAPSRTPLLLPLLLSHNLPTPRVH